MVKSSRCAVAAPSQQRQMFTQLSNCFSPCFALTSPFPFTTLNDHKSMFAILVLQMATFDKLKKSIEIHRNPTSSGPGASKSIQPQQLPEISAGLRWIPPCPWTSHSSRQRPRRFASPILRLSHRVLRGFQPIGMGWMFRFFLGEWGRA